MAEDCAHSLGRDLTAHLTIRGDEELLTQLFSNLIENALQHTPGGHPHPCSAWRAPMGTAWLRSSMTGRGSRRRICGKVTRRFYRGSSSRSSEGHGLGLSLVAAIAQLHGATLRLADAGPGLRVDLVFKRTDQVHMPDQQ